MKPSLSLVPIAGEKKRNFMKKKIVYKNAPKDISEALRVSERVPDFLPSPDKLVFK
jgi:hypothetical protein